VIQEVRTPVIHRTEMQTGILKELRLDERRPGLLFVISGPSGVGKDAVIKSLRRRKADLHFVVTATTRRKRWNEVHGKDYYFVTEAEFMHMRAEGELLEDAVYSENHYGVPKQQLRQVLNEGQDAIMRIDVQGAATIHGKAPGAVFIFLAPESMDELRARLLRRREADGRDIDRRMERADREMLEQPNFEYTVINRTGRLRQAVDDVEAIICAEHCRTKRRKIII
jgi:guanylate kinase